MIDHIMDHKTSLNKFEIIKITQSIFPDQNRIKISIINRRTFGKHQKIMP